MNDALLLDTCALIWLVTGELRDGPATARLLDALRGDAVLVSVVSAWEVGLLSRSGRVAFAPDPVGWFRKAVAQPGLTLAALTPEIAIGSSLLPGDLHGDPGDRLIAATARALDLTVVTRDRRLLDYAEAKHMRALRC